MQNTSRCGPEGSFDSTKHTHVCHARTIQGAHHGNSAPWLGAHLIDQSWVDSDSPHNTHTNHRLLTDTGPVLGVYLQLRHVLYMVTHITHLWMIYTSCKSQRVTLFGPRVPPNTRNHGLRGQNRCRIRASMGPRVVLTRPNTLMCATHVLYKVFTMVTPLHGLELT